MKMKPLTEFCALNMGQSPSSETYNDENVGLPFFQGNADFGEVHPKVRIWCSSPVKVAAAGDILISVRAPIGAMNIANTPCCIGRGLAALSLNPGTCVQEYLYYALQSRIDSLIAQGTGSTFKAIGKKTLEDTQIPAYSLDEQQIISDTLSETDQLITKTKAQVSLLDQLVKSRFVEMFGDPVTNSAGRKQVPFSSFMMGIRYGASQPPEFSENGEHKFIRATNIKNGHITEKDMLRISVAEAVKIEKCKLHGNEIIIVRSGANTGDTCVVTEKYVNQYAGYDIIVSLDLSKANPVFFNELINTSYMQRIIKPLTARSAQPHLNAQQVSALPMIVASLDEQNKFAAFVAEVDKSKLAVQQSLEKLETLKKSLMQQYFG